MHYFVDTSKTIEHIVYMMQTNKGDNIMEPTSQQRENAEKYFVPKYLGKTFKIIKFHNAHLLKDLIDV